MGRSLARSNQHFRRAVRRLPLGVSSNYRYWGDDRTLYLSRAQGARLWDLDDNEYIDYRLGYGPTILGYAHPEVDAAACEAMKVGGCSAISTEREIEVAERIAGMVPTAERIRFANSGAEAVNAALRIARAHTGRDAYVLVEGCFHGLFDSVLWRTETMADGRRKLVPDSSGVPRMLGELVHQVRLNDPEQLRKVFARSGHELAAFLIEPIQGNCGSISATPEYLETARKLCDRYEVALIVDEVKTGFRVARGGAQQLLNVRGDLSTFAKAVANGYPISVVAGREDVMRCIDDDGVPQGGTYAGHPVSLAAAAATLRILDETDALERIESYGRRLQAELGRVLETRGIPYVFVGHPSMAGLFLAEEMPRNLDDWERSDYALYNAMARHLNDLGILCEPDSFEPWFISAAHDEACLSETADKFERALDLALEERASQRASRVIVA